MRHLTIRVPWHEKRWTGVVCPHPSKNPFCLTLDRIREGRKDENEEQVAGIHFGDLAHEDQPPCIAESAAFMTDREWTRTFDHPYKKNKHTRETHGCLKTTKVKVPAYATFAVPFAWMLRRNQDAIDNRLPAPLPPDDEAPFPSPWVFSGVRQEALSNLFFGQITPEKSLVFFYCKEGQPVDETASRLVVGVGVIENDPGILRYDSEADHTYPFWDRVIRHSIRWDGTQGFVLPYHEYLEPTGDSDEDVRRRALLDQIKVEVDDAHTLAFSYGSELADSEAALSTLVRCLASVRAIKQHGIVKGPWDAREDWLNEQIAAAWRYRGAFPGLGAVLEALGLRLGTALMQELSATGVIKPEDDPWPVVDAILRGSQKPPQSAYKADIDAVRLTWVNMPEERRRLAHLLSRFNLNLKQARRWFELKERGKATETAVSDAEILANPYRIAETDLGEWDDLPIGIGTIDRGLRPDSTIAARHPVPAPSAVDSPNDPRRVRAAICAVLRRAAEKGDSLLSASEVGDRLAELDLTSPVTIGNDWFSANAVTLQGVVEPVEILTGSKRDVPISALQLRELQARENRLRKIMSARAAKRLGSYGADWRELILTSIRESNGAFDEKNPRHLEALAEQTEALERVTTRKLSALVGRAGTGKTSVLGALLRLPALVADGILLLAPTGKARVRLGKAVQAEAMTVAQFLSQCKRYDGARQRPLFSGTITYAKARTVVIDECSMLTMDDLLAVIEALDQSYVQRIILVGDPNQLPPIGVGRPFADFVAMLDDAAQSKDPVVQVLSDALGRLSVEVRATHGGRSDTLRLASWFTREAQPVDADRVLSDVELGGAFNDLEISYWKTPEDLRERLTEQLQKHVGLNGGDDVLGFNRALGFGEDGLIDFDAKSKVEDFQILSPVRMHPYGVFDLNRWVQGRFRKKELLKSREPWGKSLGDEEIVRGDKVIQTLNQKREGWGRSVGKVETYLANGEIGLVAYEKNGFFNVLFADRPGLTFGYHSKEFSKGWGVLELAYALTVHKSQGSEFKTVFVVLPKKCGLMSRELLYTALTRSKDRLVLLVEGDEAAWLYDYTKPEKSDTARRNTNLFHGTIRARADEVPYAENLIHRAEDGTLVRSKSELVIANMLHRMNIKGHYELPLEGETTTRRLRPDFTFIDPAGDKIIWEHLGMMSKPDYRQSWEWKLNWYEQNGYFLGQNLFTTQDDEKGGLDSETVRAVAEKIESLI